MKSWDYIAFTGAGKPDNGVLQAETLEAAAEMLRQRGLFVRSLTAADGVCDRTTKPNTNEVMFDDLMKETEIKARIMDHSKDESESKEEPAQQLAQPEEPKESIPTDEVVLTTPEKKDLLERLLKASLIAEFLKNQGCPEELSKKVRVALITEAAKQALPKREEDAQ